MVECYHGHFHLLKEIIICLSCICTCALESGTVHIPNVKNGMYSGSEKVSESGKVS